MVTLDEDTVTSLEDISSCDAYKVLDTLVQIGQISEERAADIRSKYDALHAALVAAMEREKQLLATGQSLHKDALASADAAAAAAAKAAEFEGVSIEGLRGDVESTLSEASLGQERTTLLQLEVAELTRARDQLAEQLEGAAESHASSLAPVITSCQEDIQTLSAEKEAAAAQLAEQQAALAAARLKLQEVSNAVLTLQGEHKATTNLLLAVSAGPEKSRRQADLAVAELASAQASLAACESRVSEMEVAVKGAVEHVRPRLEHAQLLALAERGRIMSNTKERHIDDMSRDLELAGMEAEKILADAVDLDAAIRAMASKVRQQHNLLGAASREKEAALRRLKAAEKALHEAQESIPPLRINRDVTSKELSQLQAAAVELSKQAGVLQQEVDVRVAAFLKEEGLGQAQAAMYDIVRQEVALLQDQLAGFKEEDRQLQRLLGDSAAQRDRAARAVAVKRSKVRGAQSEATLRARELEDLGRVRAEVLARSRDCEKLYDLVRNQRNKFVTLIGAAKQAAAEMLERLSLLAAEQGVLQQEVAAKAKLVNQAKAQHTRAVKERDTLRTELHGLGAAFRDKHSALEEQIASIEMVSGLINRAEADMSANRDTYQAAVQSRNNTGLLVIDRNDELCVLYEKAHLQEALLAKGQVALQQKDNELRVLGLQLGELQRTIAATRASLPDTTGVDKSVAELKAALLKTQREAAALEEAVESPANEGRYRLLRGKIPDQEELLAKLQAVEEQLSMREECLLEKAVVLEEVGALTADLRDTTATARVKGLALAQAASTTKAQLADVTRRLMATISELSLYQATALKLQGERAALVQLVEDAKARLAAGAAPTDDADADWVRAQRQRDTLDRLAEQRAEVAAVLDAKGLDLKTTAPPRPNAYIPEDLGIPKPYGHFTPFKPSAPGATMRHVRKPAPQDIVI